MKSWILLFVISAVAIEVLGLNKEELIETCIKEKNITRQALIEDKRVKPSTDPALRCFYACLAKRLGWLSENGSINTDRLINTPMSQIPEYARAEVRYILDSCNQVYKNECETSYYLHRCLEAHLQSS